MHYLQNYQTKKDKCYEKCKFYLDKDLFDELESIIRNKHLIVFKNLCNLIKDINKIRNNLVHITKGQDSPQTIQSDLQQIIESFNQQCLKDRFLQNLHFIAR